MIYHITTYHDWRTAYQQGEYRPPSLETDGFIHFSTAQQVLTVANAFYRDVADLVLLCVEEQHLIAPHRYEAALHPNADAAADMADSERFPHVYGALNLEAIVKVFPLWQSENGFVVPPEIGQAAI